MSTWPESKLVEKPCRDCGEIMECTPKREVCSKCRRKVERENKRRKTKTGG